MTRCSTFLKYPLAVLAETPAKYIFMYCNASSTALTAVRCFQFQKKVLEQCATLYQRSDRIFKHLCLWLRNEHGRQFLEEFAPRPVGRNENDTHAFLLVFPTKGKKDRLIAGYPRPGSDVAFHTDVPNVMQISKNRFSLLALNSSSGGMIVYV